MTSHQHRSETSSAGRRMRGGGAAMRLALAAPLVVALPLLAGCATAGAQQRPEVSPVAETTPSAAAPEGGDAIVAAAVESIEQRFERWSTGDHEGTCELLSEGAWQRIAATAGIEAPDCVAALAAVDEHTDGVVAKAESDGVEILTPYFWMPESISVDTSGFEVDSETLVYVPDRSIAVVDDTGFSDGPAKLPGWLEESFYVQLIDGTWTVVLSTER